VFIDFYQFLHRLFHSFRRRNARRLWQSTWLSWTNAATLAIVAISESATLVAPVAEDVVYHAREEPAAAIVREAVDAVSAAVVRVKEGLATSVCF
jgi:hypothetical protein